MNRPWDRARPARPLQPTDALGPSGRDARAPKAAPWAMAPGLRRLARRQGARPALAPVWPCGQTEAAAPADLVVRLAEHTLALEGVAEVAPPERMVGRAFALDESLAKGQPEAFVRGAVWLVLRPDGSMQLNLRPEWAAKVGARGWAIVHPLARYMAGAVPPQSLVVYAPRDAGEFRVAARIAEAAHSYAMGRIGDLVLPDTRW